MNMTKTGLHPAPRNPPPTVMPCSGASSYGITLISLNYWVFSTKRSFFIFGTRDATRLPMCMRKVKEINQSTILVLSFDNINTLLKILQHNSIKRILVLNVLGFLPFDLHKDKIQDVSLFVQFRQWPVTIHNKIMSAKLGKKSKKHISVFFSLS